MRLRAPLRPARRRALDGELWFYGRALGFAPVMPADFEPFSIENASLPGGAGAGPLRAYGTFRAGDYTKA